MKLVAGLGNPGPKYQSTRHNAGFMVVDKVADYYNRPLTKEEKEAKISKVKVNRETVLLTKPQTYMNKSGKAVGQLADYYQIDPADILVIYDDLDLEPGQIRIRPGGGHGGHNGIKSIFSQLGTKKFPRLRIGIGKPDNRPVSDYVLDQFNQEQWSAVEPVFEKAEQAVRDYLNQVSLDSIMNKYN